MADYISYATAAVEALQGWYNNATGLWNSTQWWNAANALEAVIDYSSLTRTNRYYGVIANTFEKNKHTNFLSNYYDDDGWWALAWIKAYDLVRDARYLDMAKTIFAEITKGWDQVCGGGVWWRKDRHYKAAIANELFLTAAGRLYRRTRVDSYLTWAKKEWDWFQKSGLLNAQNLINDGLDDKCQNNGQTTWTYNQGVILGGLVEMYYIAPGGAAGSSNYLQIAQSIADAAITTLVDQNGILTEPCEKNGDCGVDGPQFKGIFTRNLAYLYRTLVQEKSDPSSSEQYKQFIITNADSIWEKDRTSNNQFGLRWAGPVDKTDAARQTSALDTFNAAITVSTST